MTKGNSINLTWEQLRFICEEALISRKNRLSSAFISPELVRIKGDIWFIEKIIDFLKEKKGIIQIIEEGDEMPHEGCFKPLDYIEAEHDYRRCQRMKGHTGDC